VRYFEEQWKKYNIHVIKSEIKEGYYNTKEVDRLNLRHGLTTYYCGGNSKLSTQEYVQDVKHGLYNHWYVNGPLMFQIMYQNGVRHGAYQSWELDGNLEITSNYQNGLEEGLEIDYSDDDRTWREHHKGVQHGLDINWWSNGGRKTQCRYVGGSRHGPLIKWDENGKKFQVSTYVNGIGH
jgi:antitoxin component YwqK of YwqJK toxin-antitoxin module